MGTGRTASGDMGLQHLLASSSTCALYLTDALESKRSDLIAEALQEICLARGKDKGRIEGGGDLRVADLLEAVQSSGLRLVAFPVR